MLAKKNEEIRDAVDILEVISRDKAFRDQYFSRQMAIHDAVTREKHACEKGLEEGIEKGRYAAGVKLAKNGMKIDAIAAMLELDEDKLRQLLNSPDTQD